MKKPTWPTDMDTQKQLNTEQTEALFLLALIDEGTDVIRRVLERFVDLRDNQTLFVHRMLNKKNS